MKKHICSPLLLLLSILMIFFLGSCQEEAAPRDEDPDPTSDGVGDYLVSPSGKIVYSCHLLVFTSEIENKIVQIYQRFGPSPIPDPMDYLHRWYEF